MKFSNKDFFSKCDQIPKKLWIWSHLLKKSLLENFIFCAVSQFESGWLFKQKKKKAWKFRNQEIEECHIYLIFCTLQLRLECRFCQLP